MKKQTLTFLGKDSGFGAENTSAYIEDGENLYLIDCGCTVFYKVKMNLEIEKYKEIYVIITHLHNDHAGSLSQLILYSWFILKKKINVVTRCTKIKEYLDITGVPNESYILLNKINNLEFIETMHTNYLDSYGFKINIKDNNIVYTSDTNTLEPFIPYLKGIDELYIDVSRFGGAHLQIDNIINILYKIKSNGTKIFLMHLDDIKYIKKRTKNDFFI